MYPVLQPIDWKHFAPTEPRNNSEPWFYKHFVPTGPFKKVTPRFMTISGKSATGSLADPKPGGLTHYACLLYFSPASIAKGRRFCLGGSGQVANFVKAQGGL